jgi:uncharacterized protein (TIGR00369 family)
VHGQCLICGADDPLGLHLQFQPAEDGSMTVVFPGNTRFQGYADQLHGGMIATLFDTAMTHCLFANELTGVTAALNVRFRRPVAAGEAAQVSARILRRKLRLCRLSAKLNQNGVCKATATAAFWLEDHPDNCTPQKHQADSSLKEDGRS